MSLNQTASMNKKKVRRYGDVFGTIDFECRQSISETEFKDKGERAVIGEFQIGGKTFPVTISELKRIAETADAAVETTVKKYKLGRMR